MRTERQMQFAQIRGLLTRFHLPHSDPVWQTIEKLEDEVGNITSTQLSLVETLIEQIEIGRAHV